jgi:hypothetical protein
VARRATLQKNRTRRALRSDALGKMAAISSLNYTTVLPETPRARAMRGAADGQRHRIRCVQRWKFDKSGVIQYDWKW